MVTHSFTNANDGGINIDSGTNTITYTGLEPIIDNLNATDRVFIFNGADEAVTLSDDMTANDGISFIDSTLGESVQFVNPTNSLTIDTASGSGLDDIHIEGLDSLFDADLTITGDADDFVLFQTNATDIGTGELDVTGLSIVLQQDVTTSGADVTLTAADNVVVLAGLQSGGGNITLHADSDSMTGGVIIVDGSITSAGGDITLGGGSDPATMPATGPAMPDDDGIHITGLVDSMSGSISIRGASTADDGVHIGGTASVLSTSGSITVIGDASGGGEDGVRANGIIASQSGTITITGTGDSGHGVNIPAGATINAPNQGAVITGTTTTGDGVRLEGSVTSSNGDIHLIGSSTADDGIDLEGTVSGANITLTTDTLDMNDGSPSLLSSGDLLITPEMPSTTIGIGDGASGTLNLDTVELGILQECLNSITIGDATNGTGAVDINDSTFLNPITIVGGPITVNQLEAIDSSTNLQDVTLTARTGSITDGGGDPFDVRGNHVTLTAELGSIGSNSSGAQIEISATSLSTDSSNGSSNNGNQYLSIANNGVAETTSLISVDAGTGTLTLSQGTLESSASDIISDSTNVSVQTAAVLDLNDFDETINSLSGSGLTDLGDGNLTVTLSGSAFYSGQLTGVGDVIMDGVGRWTLAGNSDYTGQTFVNTGEIWIQSNTALGAGGPASNTVVADGAELYAVGMLTVGEDVDLAGELAVGSSASNVLWTGDITLIGANAEIEANFVDDRLEISGDVTGTQFDFVGDGLLVLSGTNNDYSGPTFVRSGLVSVEGTVTTSNFIITGEGLGNPAGVLLGDGVIVGTVTLADSTVLFPGTAAFLGALPVPGILETGDVAFSSGSTFLVQINDLAPGTGHSQLAVTGTVDLGSASLDLDDTNFDASNGGIITLIDNDGSDAVLGTFDGLAEGSTVTLDGVAFVVSYVGGDGNDVVLIGSMIEFSAATFQYSEDGIAVGAEVTVTRSTTAGTSGVQVTFPGMGSATEVTDYANAPINITFNPGDDTQTVTLSLVDDDIVELDEAFGIRLAGVTGAVLGSQETATVTIQNNDAATLSIDDVTIDETDSGPTTFTFTVTLDTEVDTGVSFDFATANDTATSGNDYTAIASMTRNFGSLTAGATETITVQVTGDVKVELDETFFLNLSSIAASGRDVTFADNQGLGTIENDDSATISIDDVTLDEGDTGTTTFTFTVTLDTEVDTGVSFDFATTDNTATTADGDYVGISTTTRSFSSTQAGSTETITVQVNGDWTVERDESFFLNLSGISAVGRDVTFSDSQGLGTIENDDSATISINDVTLNEGNTGTTTFLFTVTLDTEVDTGVSFDFATADNTATTADGDYVGISTTTRSFSSTQAGSTEIIAVQVNGDGTVELDQTFFLDLSGISAGGRDVTFADDEGLGTILNDDASVLTIRDSIVQEGDSGITPFIFELEFDQPISFSDVVFLASTVDGTATAWEDYVPLFSVPVLIPAGETTATVIVDGLGDKIAEAHETFSLYLFADDAELPFTFADGNPYLGGGQGTIATDDRETELIITGNGGTSVMSRNMETGEVTIEPFAFDFDGTARVTSGDVNGDGRPDIITGAGPGGGPHIQAFDLESGELLLEFFAFSPGFRGGVFVASGDTNHDGFDDIIVGADAGGGPHVRVFSGLDPSNVLHDFFAYDVTFVGGVRVAAGDVSGDGIPDIITGPGAGGGPHVRVFDGTNAAPIANFFAFDPRFTGGVFVTSGNINEDGFDDIIVGAGPGGGPQVRVVDGQDLSTLGNFFAFDPIFRGGVEVNAADLTGDGIADIIVAPASRPNGESLGKRAFDGSTFQPLVDITPAALGDGDVTPNSPAGNRSPQVIGTLDDIEVVANTPFELQFPTNIFFDPDADPLTFELFDGFGNALPPGVSFNPSTLTFSGQLANPDILGDSAVTLVSNDNNGGATSLRLGVSVRDPQVPSRPTVSVAPAFATTPAKISWTGSVDAVRYDVSVRNLTTSQEYFRDTNVSDTQLDLPMTPIERTEFRVWVRAFNVLGQAGGWSAGRNFVFDDLAPSRPVVVGPQSRGDATPNFTWFTDLNAQQFDVGITNTDTGSSVERDRQFTGNSFVPSSVLNNGNYQFEIRATNAFGTNSAWRVLRFVVDLNAPAAPTLIAPPFRTTDSTPAFRWRNVENAVRFDLWVDNLTTGERQVIRQPMLTDTWFTPSSPLVPGVYRVQVKAFNERNEGGAWSPVHDFEILATDVKATEWIAPGDTTPNVLPTFQWTPVDGAVRYDLWVNNLTTGQTQVIRQPSLTATSFTPMTPLASGDYRAWVKVFDTNGDSIWSEANDFTVNQLGLFLAAIDAAESEVALVSTTIVDAQVSKTLVEAVTLEQSVALSSDESPDTEDSDAEAARLPEAESPIEIDHSLAMEFNPPTLVEIGNVDSVFTDIATGTISL